MLSRCFAHWNVDDNDGEDNVNFKHFRNWWNVNWCRKQQRTFYFKQTTISIVFLVDELDWKRETTRALLRLGLFLPLSQAQLNHIPCTTEHISALRNWIESIFPCFVVIFFSYRSCIALPMCIATSFMWLVFNEPNSLGATQHSVLAFVCECVRIFQLPFPVRVLSVMFS